MRRLTISSLLLVLAVLAVCNSSKHSSQSRYEPALTLPFRPPGPVDKVDKPGPVSEDLPSYDTHLDTLFDHDSVLARAFERFRDEIPRAREGGALNRLFSEFVGCDAFSDDDDAKHHEAVLTQWVADALAETDEVTRMLYSSYTGRFRTENSYYRTLYCQNRKMRPGEELRLYRYSYWRNRERADMEYTIEIARLTLDSLLKPSGFTPLVTREDVSISQDNQFRYTLDEPGVYRVVAHNDRHFQQLYVQASWLDCVVKSDPRKLLVFGSSYRDTLPPPYTVHFVSPEGDIHRVDTDSTGLVALRHHFGEEPPSDGMKIVLEKDNQLAFLENYFPRHAPDTSMEYYLYTDRPVYRPGHRVHLRGIVKLVVDGRELGAAGMDSVDITVTDPRGTQVYRDTLIVDRWGHFGDSIDLADNARQGRYQMRVNYARRSRDRSGRTYSSHSNRGSTFIVDAYKKPEFLITATPERETYFAGEEAQITVKGEYYFGGPLAGVPVKVRWYRQGMYHYFSTWGKASCRFYPHGGREFLEQQELAFDKEGSLTLRYSTPPQSAYEYVVAEVIATDQSRREIREEATVRIAKHDAYLAVLVDKYEYEVGEKADIEVVAVDLEGEPLEGSLSLRIKKDREIVTDEHLAIPQTGRVRYTLDIGEPGQYQIEASAKDRNGKIVYVERDIRAVKNRSWNWNWERIEVSPDKERYLLGDTARISVKAGADDTRALVTVEGSRINAYDIRRLKDHALEYSFVLTEELGTNVGFSIVFSGKASQASRYQQLTVIDSSALLNVTLEGPSVLEPGETFNGTLVVRDRTGRPVQAAMTVAMVDEAIFDVARSLEKTLGSGRYYYWFPKGAVTEGALTIFPPYHANKVRTRFNEFDPRYLLALGTISEAKALARKINALQGVSADMAEESLAGLASAPPVAKAMASRSMKKERAKDGFAGGEDEADKKAEEPPRERTEFKDLGYWNPDLVTSAAGKASLSFTMPDDLTKWRLVLVGSDGAAHLVDFRDSLITRQDIMVKLQAPRGFVTDDSALVTSVVHNYSGDEVEGEVELTVKEGGANVRLLGASSRSITIPKNGTERVDWPVRVTRAGAVTFYTSVTTKAGGDAESRTYPILHHGIQQVAGDAGVLSEKQPSAAITLPSPENVAPGSRVLTVEYAPSLASTMFESLEYLTGYPYGCVEQTMSRFLPNLYVASAMKKLGIEDDSLLSMIPRYTHKGLERLKQFQHGDGGWGWWEKDDTDPRMTALVLHGLNYAQHADIDEEDKALAARLFERGCRSALGMMHKTKPQETINLCYSLVGTECFDKAKPSVLQVYRQRGTLSSYSMALLAECLHAMGKKAELARVVELLETQATTAAGMTHWGGSSTYRWFSRDQESTARVLQALLEVRPNHALIQGAVVWLCRQKENGYWTSTKTTAAVIEALSRYLERSGELDPKYTAEIILNRTTLASVKVTRESLKNWQGRIVLPDSLIGDKLDLSVSMQGAGRLYYSVVLRYATTEKPVRARSNGLTVTRTYTRLLYVQDQKGEWKVERKPFKGTLRSGDELEVSVTIRPKGAYEHLLLEDFFPSGMEVLRKDEEWYGRWCRWWWRGYTHREARDDRMVFFLDYVSGERTFSYLLRAETPGTFVGLPARAELMYAPEVGGNSSETTVVIRDAR